MHLVRKQRKKTLDKVVQYVRTFSHLEKIKGGDAERPPEREYPTIAIEYT